MTISSLTSSSAISQLNHVSKLNRASSGADDGAVRAAPPPRPQGGGFINAIASALKSIGVTDSSSDTSTTSASGDAATGTENAAQALGSFLQDLMGALHEQGAASSGSATGSDTYGPPAGGPGGPGGGPGKLGADLQSLISKLGSSTGADSDGDADSTTDSSTASLESSFKNLLQALGGGDDDSATNTKLASFLQALSDNLPGAGSSGNLVNTTV